MLGNYLLQRTSADDIFRCIFFGALRVNNLKSCTNDIAILREALPLFCIFFLAMIYSDASKMSKVKKNMFRMIQRGPKEKNKINSVENPNFIYERKGIDGTRVRRKGDKGKLMVPRKKT